jgi:hypothetical protein
MGARKRRRERGGGEHCRRRRGRRACGGGGGLSMMIIYGYLNFLRFISFVIPDLLTGASTIQHREEEKESMALVAENELELTMRDMKHPLQAALYLYLYICMSIRTVFREL